MLLKLVRNACAHGTTSVSAPGRKSKYDCHDVLALSISRLEVVNSLLHCHNLSAFSEDGSRMKIPHFIPQFLMSSKHLYNTENPPQIMQDLYVNLYFSNYENSFSGILPEVVFQIVLDRLVISSEGQTSDKMLLALLNDINNECSLTRQEHTRFSRIHSNVHSGNNLHTGSALNLMIIEARLLCFALRVAYEIANDLPVPALQGGYSEMGKIVLQNIMTIPGTRWQEIFMLHVTDIAGEGKLCSLLSAKGSILYKLNWTEEWRGGLPMIGNSIEEELQEVELKLRKVEAEEQKKSQEMRLCPHCQQPFLLLANNCGQFICGHADTHIRPTNGALGCGNGFGLSQAQYYKVDQTILSPLQDAVADKRDKLQKYHAMSRVWHWMWLAELPFLSSTMSNNCNHFVPLSITVETIGNTSDIVRHLIDSRTITSTFQMLPQLIEVCYQCNIQL